MKLAARHLRTPGIKPIWEAVVGHASPLKLSDRGLAWAPSRNQLRGGECPHPLICFFQPRASVWPFDISHRARAMGLWGNCPMCHPKHLQAMDVIWSMRSRFRGLPDYARYLLLQFPDNAAVQITYIRFHVLRVGC